MQWQNCEKATVFLGKATLFPKNHPFWSAESRILPQNVCLAKIFSDRPTFYQPAAGGQI